MPILRTSLLLLAAGLSSPLFAQNQPTLSAEDLRAYVVQQAQMAAGDPAIRIEAQLGQPEAQAAVAPCRRSEPYVPAGGRLWGRSFVGVRCVDGAQWSVLFPVMVRAWGPAWVASTSLPAGATLAPGDIRQTEIELTQQRPGLPGNPEALLGKVLTRSVPAGQPVHGDAVKAPTVVAAGDVVRLRVLGGGFAITAAGQALGTAAEGQPVRVRTDFGRTLTGVARNGRVVDIQP